MNAILAIGCVVLSFVDAGPFDGFRANLGSIKVNLHFKCKFYNSSNYEDLIAELVKHPQGPGPAAKPTQIVDGLWEHDGSREHFVLTIDAGAASNRGAGTGPISPIETLRDGEILAYHKLGKKEKILNVDSTNTKYPVPMVGPFIWKSAVSFDRDMETYFSQVRPTRRMKELDGRSVEIEIYRMESEGVTRIRYVAYDPAIGYLPRLVRGTTTAEEDGKEQTYVRDMYLIDAQPCSAGGFVPVEWCKTEFTVDDTNIQSLNQDDVMKIRPRGGVTGLLYFKADGFENRKTEVALDRIDGLDRILAPGGTVPIRNFPKSISLGQLKSRLGARINPSKRPILPNIDFAELHQFDQRPGWSRWLVYSIALGFSFLLFGIILTSGKISAFYRSTFSVALILAITGCSREPVYRLKATLTPDRVLYDPSIASVPLTLTIDNLGNRSVRVLAIDAGCSCRNVDRTKLPILVGAGKKLNLGVKITDSKRFSPQEILFTITTNVGNMFLPTVLSALPRHHLSPSSITLNGLHATDNHRAGAVEEEEMFEFVHREIFNPDEPKDLTELVVPPEFSSSIQSTRIGRVDWAPEYSYQDTTYQVILKDQTTGLHHADIRLRGQDRRQILSLPLVWQRHPFLSSVPERIILANRSIRAFLRCPDENVEFARILSSPAGVKAVIETPREIRVALNNDAPGVINGVIEIATTANEASPLRIPVVRYSSGSSGEKKPAPE